MRLVNRLPLPELNALAWLLDGNRMKPEETKRFVGRSSLPGVYESDEQLREIVIEMLGRALKSRSQTAGAHVRIEFNTDPDARLDELKQSSNMNASPVSDYSHRVCLRPCCTPTRHSKQPNWFRLTSGKRIAAESFSRS